MITQVGKFLNLDIGCKHFSKIKETVSDQFAV